MEEERKKFTPKQRKRLLELHNNQCDNCGSTNFLELHHVVPIAIGGSNRESNIACLCRNCHRIAHKRCVAGREAIDIPDELVKRYIFSMISRQEFAQLAGISERTNPVRVDEIMKSLEIKSFKNTVHRKKTRQRGYVVMRDEMLLIYDSRTKENEILISVPNNPQNLGNIPTELGIKIDWPWGESETVKPIKKDILTLEKYIERLKAL